MAELLKHRTRDPKSGVRIPVQATTFSPLPPSLKSQDVKEGRGSFYLTLHCYHQNDLRIKMGSDVNNCNAWLIVQSYCLEAVSINHIILLLNGKVSRSGESNLGPSV